MTLLVDHAGDLVGDEQRGLARQRGRHRQPLQFTAGQTSGVAFGVRFQADFAKQLGHVSGCPGGRPHTTSSATRVPST